MQGTRGSHARFNVPLKTWGGKQFWCDHTIFAGWRIQQHWYTRHFRLLDPRDKRRAWGGLVACEHALERAKHRGDATRTSNRLCLLVHGLGRSKDSMKRLRSALAAAGFEAYSVNYPSTRQSLAAAAASVAGVVRRCAPDVDEISFVTHSLGGMVARVALAMPDMPRVSRMVMIAPPSQGSELADMVLERAFVRLTLGPSALDMRSKSAAPAAVPPPPCPFLIIAGGRGTHRGWNPILVGDNDGVLTVESTQLSGATSFRVAPHTHTFMTNSPDVIDSSVAFITEDTVSTVSSTTISS